jgi:hypothetical protein
MGPRMVASLREGLERSAASEEWIGEDEKSIEIQDDRVKRGILPICLQLGQSVGEAYQAVLPSPFSGVLQRYLGNGSLS